MASLKNLSITTADGSALSIEQLTALLASQGISIQLPVAAPKVAFTDDVKAARVAAHEDALAAYDIVAAQLNELHARVRSTTADLVEAGCQAGHRYPELGERVEAADIMTATSRAPRNPIEGEITPRGVNPYRLAVYFADLEVGVEMKNSDVIAASNIDGANPLIAKAVTAGHLSKVGTTSRSGRFKINEKLSVEEWYATFYGGDRISFDQAREATEKYLAAQAGPAPESVDDSSDEGSSEGSES
jgi:hypothetical protein